VRAVCGIRALVTLVLLGAAGCLATPAPNAWLAVDVAAGLAREADTSAIARVAVVVDVTPSMAAGNFVRSSNPEVAQIAAAHLLRSLPQDVPTSLVAFGTRGPACEAPPLLLGPESGRPGVLALRAEELSPAAEASLASALDSVAAELAAGPVGDRTRVVVFSDFEPKCGGDLCEAGERLVSTGATLDLVVLGGGQVPACLRSPAPPVGLPDVVSRGTDLPPVSFRLVAAPDGPPRVPANGVAGERPLRVDPGAAMVELALSPPLDVPVLLSAGALLRLRVMDFPAASPPVRDWLVQTEAPPAETTGVASPP
jgi:hypothetical protein